MKDCRTSWTWFILLFTSCNYMNKVLHKSRDFTLIYKSLSKKCLIVMAARCGFNTDTIKSHKYWCNEFISNSFLIRNVLFALNHFIYQIQILISICIDYKIQDTYVNTFKSLIKYQDHILSFLQYLLVT